MEDGSPPILAPSDANEFSAIKDLSFCKLIMARKVATWEHELKIDRTFCS